MVSEIQMAEEVRFDARSASSSHMSRTNEILYRNAVAGSVISLVNVTIFAALLYGNIRPDWMLIGFALAVGAGIARTAVAKHALKTPQTAKTLHARAVAALSVITGICWGAPALLLSPDANPMAEHLIVFMIAGMTAGASVAFATDRSIVYASNVPPLLLLSIHYAMMGTTFSLAMIAIITLYFLATLSLANRMSNALSSALSSQAEAEQKQLELAQKKQELDREVSARKASEDALRETLFGIRKFNSSIDAVFKTYLDDYHSPRVLVRSLVELLSEALQVERVGVWEYLPDRSGIVCTDFYQQSQNRHDSGMVLRAEDNPAYFSALEDSVVIAAGNAHLDPRTIAFRDSYLIPNGITALLDAPIRMSRGVRGVICCEAQDKPRVWSPDEIALLTSAAQFISMSMFTHELVQSEENLKVALREAEKASIAKSQFLATMTHEIRTPLTGVLGMLDLMKQAGMEDAQLQKLNVAYQSAKSLLTILNDILEFSKLEGKHAPLEIVAFDLHDTLAGIVSLFQSPAQEKGLEVGLSMEDTLPRWIKGDPLRIRQIVTNLVGNAVKFTESGRVDVALSATGGPRERVLRIEVMDTGIGISAEAQKQLFERFEQADSSITRRFGGTGLGLAICKELVQLMGGEIGLRSEPGAGSVFWVTIPVEIAEPADAQPCETQPEKPDLVAVDPLKILVAEDNETNQALIKAFLTADNHDVTVAANGELAVAAVRTGQYDLVLMDIQMPQMDGITATGIIRTLSPPLCNIPIVALTANAFEGDRERFLAAGMDDYISKPIDVDELTRVIARTAGAAGPNLAHDVMTGSA